MKVIFVRHAETEWNSRGIIQGHSDSALTHRGLRETSALLAALAASDYQIECIYASPLGRAWQMGQRLAEGFHCSLLAEAALKEQAFGQFEGMSANHLLQNHHDDADALFRFDAAYCPPGGESLAHASQRVISFYTVWRQPHLIKQYVLCLTGTSVRALLPPSKKVLSIISPGTLNPTRATPFSS